MLAALLAAPAAARPSDSARPAQQCGVAVAGADRLNAPELNRGALACAAAGRPIEGNFLFLAATVRGLVDVYAMPPETHAGAEQNPSVRAAAAFRDSFPELMRTPAARERLFAMFDEWSPAYPDDYTPGWTSRQARTDPAIYRAMLARNKQDFRPYLDVNARLYSDDVYYGLDRRIREIRAKNPNGLHGETAERTELERLSREQNARCVFLVGYC